MCGRFNIDVDDLLLRGFVDDVKRQNQDIKINTGEIFPTNVVPIISEGGVTGAKWGFPKFNGGGVIINSRAETVTDKPIFRDSFMLRRCVIPCSGYYEWDARRNKQFIFPVSDNRIYLCGFYKRIESVDCFVIMTADSRGSVGAIHNRMPLAADEKTAEAWINDADYASEYYLNMNPSLDYKGV